MSDQLADALLAARLLAIAPRQLGGLCLRGGGLARDLALAALPDLPACRLPLTIDDERLLGGIDIAASLVQGAPVRSRGLLADAAGGLLLVPLAERLLASVAGKVAQAMDQGDGFGLILLDDGLTPDECVPAALRERVAFAIDLTRVKSLEISDRSDTLSLPFDAVEPANDTAMAALAATGIALGVGSARAQNFAFAAARAHAALMGRCKIADQDVVTAARLVLAPRATRVPVADDERAEPEPQSTPDEGDGSTQGASTEPLDNVVLDAALATIPSDLLAQLATGRASRARAGGKGRRTTSKLRGRPLGARPGVPRGGAQLALVDTLRAAVPWQTLRRTQQGRTGSGGMLIRKADLRIRRFEERAASVTIFVVDASGSAAMARLAEAKGAVELMLAQAYVKRSAVALIAFRGEGAELLLPPTRSLTRARRELAQLPGGGGTPLANGITAARRLAEAIAPRGRTPFLVFLTDGSANVSGDGSPGRGKAREDALAAARHVATQGIAAIVVDIAPRPRPEARELAEAMRALYLPLPMADAHALATAVGAAETTVRAA